MSFRRTAGIRNGQGRVATLSTSAEAVKKRNQRIRRMTGEPPRKRFIPWDGEGITHFGERQQSYVLFGCSPSEYISGRSLGTVDLFEFMIGISEKYGSDVIHVAFAFSYDVNMILRDVPEEFLDRISKGLPTWWGDYRIHWINRKWFKLTKRWVDFEKKQRNVSITIYDVFTFFASSFVKVCKDYLEGEDIAIVEAGKAMRDEFTWAQFESVVLPYWQSEIGLIAKVMERYREILYSVGIYITQWYGPGAAATYEMKKHGVQAHIVRDLPDEVVEAATYAYAGGRFELFKTGHYMGKVYSYDINSAYPYAFTLVRSIAPENGTWVHRTEIDRTQPISPNMAMYRIRYNLNGITAEVPDFAKDPDITEETLTDDLFRRIVDATRTTLRTNIGIKTTYDIQPLFYREEHGDIKYPAMSHGWYWDPEASLVWDDPKAEIVEAWEFVPTNVVYPFKFIEGNFKRRLKLKSEGNPGQLGLKLGMNSMYGKVAQRIGWNVITGEPPRWHQLEYAGWITSKTRAMIYTLAKKADEMGGLIACETDGIYSTVPLDDFCDVGDQLGQWERSIYDGITYVQSGFYWKLDEGTWKAKYRGLDPEAVTHESMIEFMSQIGGEECPECKRIRIGNLKPSQEIDENHTCKYRATSRRFRGVRIALMSKEKLKSWRVWDTVNKVFTPSDQSSKRIHKVLTCPTCKLGLKFSEGFHPMSAAQPYRVDMSTAHNLPWRSGGLTEGQEGIALEMADQVLTGYEEDGLTSDE